MNRHGSCLRGGLTRSLRLITLAGVRANRPEEGAYSTPADLRTGLIVRAQKSQACLKEGGLSTTLRDKASLLSGGYTYGAGP